MRVGIDLDGVCFDFRASLLRYMEAVGLDKEVDLNIPYRHWNFFEDWGWDVAKFVQVCNDGADAGFIFSGGYNDNAPESIRRIKNAGNSVHIITDRKFGRTPAVSEALTRKWLWEHNIPYDTLTFSADKTCIPTDVFIEDKLQNYDALWAAGTYCYLVDRPWNQDETTWRRRVKSIDEFAALIEQFQYSGRSI